MARLDLLMNNTGLLVSVSLLIGGLLIVGLMAGLMARAGASLRPMIWFGSIFLLIVGPQIAVHLFRALQADSAAIGSAPSGWWQLPTSAPSTPEDLNRYFGGRVADAMVSDVEQMFVSAGSSPRWARFAIFGDGTTAIIAGFADGQSAEQGMHSWLALSGLSAQAGGDLKSGFSGARPAGDRVFVTVAGCHLGIWSAATTSALMATVRDSTFPPLTYQHVQAQQGDAVVEPPPFGLSWPASIGLLIVYALAVSCVFIKGAAWASAVPAASVVAVSAAELRHRLMAVASSDVPFEVREAGRDGALEVEWRYADARWLDHAAGHRIVRVHRLVMHLDESRNAVLVTDYQTRFDGSVGVDRASLRWAFSSGIVFFQREYEANFGLHLDEKGNPTGVLRQSWRFNVDEMKEPLIAVVRQSGWRWQPVLLEVPPFWRWAVT